MGKTESRADGRRGVRERVLQALYGKSSAQGDYADILFGSREKGRSALSQFVNDGRYEDVVLTRMNRMLAVLRYDEDLEDEGGLTLDALMATLQKREGELREGLVGQVKRLAATVCEIGASSTAEGPSADTVELLRMVWMGVEIALGDVAAVSYREMTELVRDLGPAFAATLRTAPGLKGEVRTVRALLLAKMGPSWSRTLETFGREKPVAERRREVLDLYARITGEPVRADLREKFCGGRPEKVQNY